MYRRFALAASLASAALLPATSSATPPQVQTHSAIPPQSLQQTSIPPGLGNTFEDIQIGGVQNGGKRAGNAKHIDPKPLVTVVKKHAGWDATIAGGRPMATPAIEGDRIYVGGGFGSHEFYALDRATGTPVWAVNVSDDGPTAAVVSHGRAVFNTESCTLFVVDARTGDHLWSEWLGDPLMSQPAVADKRVFMVYPSASGHRLLALSLDDGTHLWEGALEGDVISAPIVEGGKVYATTFDGTVYRFDAKSGALDWKRAMKATSAPWIDGRGVYVSQRDAAATGRAPGPMEPPPPGGKELEPPPTTESLRRIDFEDATIEGKVLAPKAAPYIDPRVQNKSKYYTSQGEQDSSVGFGGGAPAAAKGHAALANVGQGTVNGLWEFQGSRPVAISGQLISTMGDSVRSVNGQSGVVAWDVKLTGDAAAEGGFLATPPVIVGGRIYVATISGHLLVLDLSSGKTLRQLEVGYPTRFQPAVDQGVAYVGTANGHLVALDLDDQSATGWTMWGGGPSHNGPGK